MCNTHIFLLRRFTRYTLLFSIIIIININCQDTSNNYLDIHNLSTIEVTLINEIGVDDEHIFGQLRDLILLPDLNLFVSDWGNVSIEQFNKEGKYIGRVAEKGRGPGELSSFFLLHKGGKDTLIVRYRGMSQQIDQFSQGTEKDRYVHTGSIMMEEFSDLHITFSGKRSESEFYALASRNSRDLRSANTTYPVYTQTSVVVVDKFENILQDSLHLLKSPNPVAKFNQNSMFVIGMPPYQSHDRFRLLKDGKYLIAYPDSSAIYLYDDKHNLERVINLKMKPRPVEEVDIESNLKKIPKEYHDDMKKRIPEFKPPFLNVWTSGNHIILLFEKAVDGLDLLVFDLKGDLVGKFMLSKFDDIKAFHNNYIYTIHRNPEMGDRIRIYKFENFDV